MRRRLYRGTANVKGHTKDADGYFGALGFTLPVEELTLRSTSLANVLSWLTQPQGPSLIDRTSTENQLTALAILVSPEAFKDPDSPLVGLGFLYKAPYIRTASWSEAYFELKLASQAAAGSRPLGTRVIFVQILMNSEVIPLPSVPTLDVKASESITDSKASRPTRDFRGFQLFKVVDTGEDPPVAQVAIPHLQGQVTVHWTAAQDQVLPPNWEDGPQVSADLAAADPYHWNVLNDPVYPSCVEQFRVRHGASTASAAAPPVMPAGTQGGNLTPTTDFPASWPTQPITPSLTGRDIDARVTEVMDQVYDLSLRWMQEMGLIRGIDHDLSKSLMVEFLRLQVLMGEDLSTSLRAWRVDMEAVVDDLVRDLEAAAQVGTPPAVPRSCRPGNSPAVLSCRQTEGRLPSGPVGGDPRMGRGLHANPYSRNAVPTGDKGPGGGAFLADRRPPGQGPPDAVG